MILCLSQLQRPEADLMGSAIFTAGLLTFTENTMDSSLSRNCEPFRQAALIRVRVKLYDGHRRGGRKVMRVKRFQNRLGKTGKFGVQFQLYPCREKRETLQQSFHIRVGARKFIQ